LTNASAAHENAAARSPRNTPTAMPATSPVRILDDDDMIGDFDQQECRPVPGRSAPGGTVPVTTGGNAAHDRP
jgi:hypothetical protein